MCQSATGICSFVRGGTGGGTKWPPAGNCCSCFWPNCQKQTPWGWHEGQMSSSRTCAHSPAPCSSTGICERETRVGRSATGAPFSSQMIAGSNWAQVTGVKDWRLLGTGMKSSEKLSELMWVQWARVPPGAGQWVCRQFLDDVGIDAIDWPSRSPDLNPIYRYVSCIQRRQVPPLTVQELTDALIQVWEEIPQETICRLMRSLPRRCREYTQSRRDHTQYWVTLWVAMIKFRWISLWFQFLTLIFGAIFSP